MASSMTGFASAELSKDSFRIVWEVRSVNHRFLDVSLRLPEELRRLEPRCKEVIGAVIRRGKLECSLRIAGIAGANAGVGLHQEGLDHLLDLQNVVLQRCPAAEPLDVAAILRWPGVLEDPGLLSEQVEETAIETLVTVLDALHASREREGERLARLLRQRCESIASLITTIVPKLPDAERHYRAKLTERLERFDLKADSERLEQELVLVAQRFDVSEELDRLSSHLREIEVTLNMDEAIGRRLDFIIQELNREANTFASKIQDEELTRAAVEIKVLIEQMREQAQNLE
jgi:uncharacterized protein (TIGR00255 family)